jgi:hypothetical protein
LIDVYDCKTRYKLKKINPCVNQGGMHNQFVKIKMNLFIYSNLFVMGKLIMFLVSHEVVITINKMFKDLISWPSGNEMHVMVGFRNRCGLPSIQGAINGTCIYKAKHSRPFLEDYEWVQHHCISNNQLQQDIHQPFVGLRGKVNDFKVLRRSTLHKHAQYHDLFEHTKNLCVFLLGDKGYPLISWIMTPYEKER